MKKVKIIIVLFALIFIFSSCNNTQDFSGFILIKSTRSIYHNLVKLDNVVNQGSMARVVVNSIHFDDERVYDDFYPKCVINIYINDDFNNGTIFPYNVEYGIEYIGNNNMQIYRQPIPIVGYEYLVLTIYEKQNPDILIAPTYWFKIATIDGEEYAYSYYLDIADILGVEKISNYNENLVYDEVSYNEIVKYMKKNGIPAPTFDYRIKIDTLVEALSPQNRT